MLLKMDRCKHQVRKMASAFASRKCAGSDAGFSLIELLASVAIITILAALLLPGLGRSKMSAKRLQCLSNLHQMNLAASLYLEDNSGSYPTAYYWDEANNIDYAWDLTTLAGDSHRVIPGLLWQSHGNTHIQQCPSFIGGANWLSDPYTGYNYNTSYIGHGQYEDISQPAKSSDVRHPVKTVLFGDGQYSGGADKFMRAPFPNPGDANFWGRNSGTQGFRHENRSNAAFCDGHVESLRQRCTNNIENAALHPGTGFLSSDNSRYDLE